MAKKIRGNVYPRKAVRLADGSIHMECTDCYGCGKETIYTSSSNSAGGSEGRKTKNKCIHCDGMGYEYEAIKVVEVADFKRA